MSVLPALKQRNMYGHGHHASQPNSLPINSLSHQIWHWLCEMRDMILMSIIHSPPVHVKGLKQNRVFSNPETNLQEMTTCREDVYFIVWQLGLAVTVNRAMRSVCHNLFWYFCLKMSVCPWKRGLNSEGTVQKQMDAVKSISSASKPCSSLVRRNAAYCPLNLRKSSCVRSTGGRGRLRTAYMTTLKEPEHCAPPVLAGDTSISPIEGCKVICARCVRRLFHQTVVGWSGHDLCS